MFRIVFVVFLLSFGNCYVAFAKVNSKKDKVEFATWKKIMKVGLPRVLCRKNGYIDKCFKVELNKCKSVVTANQEYCFETIRFKKKYINLSQKSEFSRRLAKCIQKRIIKRHSAFKRRVKSEACEISL